MKKIEMRKRVLSAIGIGVLGTGIAFNVNLGLQNKDMQREYRLSDVEALTEEWVSKTLVGNFEEDQSGTMSCNGVEKRWNDCKSTCNEQTCTYVLCKLGSGEQFPD